ncbi:MAG TPA: hypothetical protein VHT03_14570 [Rhizomicrobium sp.]|nr:hypothetical protein [Rhizomicrobium sp.]
MAIAVATISPAGVAKNAATPRASVPFGTAPHPAPYAALFPAQN